MTKSEAEQITEVIHLLNEQYYNHANSKYGEFTEDEILQIKHVIIRLQTEIADLKKRAQVSLKPKAQNEKHS